MNTEILTIKDRSLSGSKLDVAVQQMAEIEKLNREISTLQGNFAAASSMWTKQLSDIRTKYPNEKLSISPEINSLLQRSNVRTYNINGVETI